MSNSCPGRSILLPCVLVTGLAGIYGAAAFADVRQTADYIAIDIEAEDYDAAARQDDDERWVLTDASTSQTDQDPDGNHSNGAVGNRYVELLPDVRVKHEDGFPSPTPYWGTPGDGPTLSYAVNFPEPGRYYVHGRINSTGTEDNGIHVGLNDSWPGSGARMQWCTGGQGWAWSSRQRASGGAGDCGVNHTIWLDVEQAGLNTVRFSAREDGFELDRFVLIKDKSDNTRVCSAAGENTINCRNGSIESADDFADAAVRLEVDRTAGVQGDLFEFNAVVSNEDGFDSANQVVLEAAMDLGGAWEFVSASDSCSVSGTLLNCSLGNLSPTSPGEDENISFTLRALLGGEHTISAEVSTTSSDDEPDNDSASMTVDVEQVIFYATLESSITRNRLVPRVLDDTTLSVALSNNGEVPTENARVTFDLPAGVELSSSSEVCIPGDLVVCEIAPLAVGGQSSVSVDLTSDVPGFYPLSIVVAADNIAEGSFASTYILEVQSAEEHIVSNSGSDNTDGGVKDKPDSQQGSTSSKGSGGGSLHWLLLMLMSAWTIGRLPRQ